MCGGGCSEDCLLGAVCVLFVGSGFVFGVGFEAFLFLFSLN